MMKFIREIPTENIKNSDIALEQQGFTLVWKEESLELWFEVLDDSLDQVFGKAA